MNIQLRTFITMLLLCLFGATDGWAQSNLENVYTNNLDFLSSYSEYVGIKRNYKIGAFSETTYTNGIFSSPNGSGVRITNTISFMVPAGTRYLHFHILGGETNATLRVKSGSTTYTQSTFAIPNGASIIDTVATTSKLIVFNQSPGEPYYKCVDFNTPLEQNSQITITTQGEEKAFMVIGVKYEDAYTPHKGAERNPFTADEVYSLITDHVQPTNKVYVKGKVSTAAQLTSETDRSATFNISEDATHNNEILVDKTYSFDSQNFANANQVLPRDKVTLYCNIKVLSQSLTKGKFIQQVHPTYTAIVKDGNTTRMIKMTSGAANGNNYADYPIHSCDIGHLSAGVTSYFHIEEAYIGDETSIKTFRGPYDSTGYYTLTRANQNNIQLTDGIGSMMNVDTEGDYTLYVKQVEDGPTLDITGFPTLSYSLCYKPDLNGEDVETPFYDNGDGTFTLTESDLYWGQAFWIIREYNGETKIYGDAEDNLRIHRYNSSGIQLSPNGYDYLLLGEGSLTFTITETTDGPKLKITGWPTPVFHVLNINGEVLKASFQKQNDGSYTTMFTITEEEIGEQFAFVIYDSANDVNLGVDIDSMYVGNLSGQPVQLKTEDNCSMKLTTAGTYYMTLNPDMMLTVTKLNMTSFITNGDIEGEDMSCFFKQEPVGTNAGIIVPATFTAGAGVDGSRGIVVNTIDNAAANLWDAAFFVRLTEALPEGTKYRISFDCKASQATNVTTNIHAEPGTFLYWNGIGSVNFTTEWQHIERTGIVTSAQSPNGEMQTIGFLLSENKSATSFYFDNIVIEADLPVPEPEPTMMSVVKNGNIEGSDMSCFFKQEPIDEETTGDIVPATFTAGAGVDGSRGIVVNTIDKPNAEAWDAHFFIRLTQALPEGTKYRISFDYKASQETYVTTNIHAEPGTFLVWNAFGSMNFTTEWQHIEWTGTVTSDLSPDDNMRTIVFLLYYGKKTATSFYFDNINVEIDEDHYVYQRGDANGDGNVTIADVVTIVDYTLGKASPTFVESAADLNNDGQINVSDVVALVNILLGKDSQ